MHRSRVPDSLLSEQSAPQHEPAHAPRPLPLFLGLVRMVAETEPDIARAALDGLAAYEQAPRDENRNERPVAARAGPAALRDCGGSGPPAVLIPSLINPPSVLDLDPRVSLAEAVAGMGRKTYLLDWGAGRDRADLDVGAHVAQLLLPLLEQLGEPAALAGYCLGGTMAIAAANLVPAERVVTLAAPWHFGRYPPEGRDALARLWRHAGGTAQHLGALPMEVLQAAFWSLDPKRTVAKFAAFSQLAPESPRARRFVALEDWANDGEPLPFPAARELIEDLFAADLTGRGEWPVGGRRVQAKLGIPVLHCTAAEDRIAPAATAADGKTVQIDSGHVGMIVGSARAHLHEELNRFLSGACR